MIMGSFWDKWASFYDLGEKANARAYGDMLKTVHEFVPDGASVLEVAAGTGAISLAVSDKASIILCSDISEKMLAIAKKKAVKRGVKNISFGNLNIFETGKSDNSFDVVIASQVLHLIDNPPKAAEELRRIAKQMVIIPLSFTKNLRGMGKICVDFYRVIGFSPKIELEADEYLGFLDNIGFSSCEIVHLAGRIPMGVAVWKKSALT
jgi:ubiquinone/menaquinone biosynthesis C-methylase UbiE